MTRKQRRMTILGVGLLCLAVATALVLTALSDKVTFFYSPSELAADDAGHHARIRLGGVVEEGSVVKEADGITTAFIITDFAEAVPVRYTGVLPDPAVAPQRLHEAMRYAVLGGGKRVRPLLAHAAGALAGATCAHDT